MVPGEDALLAQVVTTSLFELFSKIKGAYSELAHQDDTFGLLAKVWLAVVPNTRQDKSVRVSIMH